MRLTIVKSEWMEDWYLIERAEHDGREWIEATSPHSSAFRRSARISDADVEGTASHMIDIGNAIEDRHNHSHKRCAVEFRDGSAFFYSPRNTNIPPVPVPLVDADALAAQIRAMLG